MISVATLMRTRPVDLARTRGVVPGQIRGWTRGVVRGWTRGWTRGAVRGWTHGWTRGVIRGWTLAVVPGRTRGPGLAKAAARTWARGVAVAWTPGVVRGWARGMVLGWSRVVTVVLVLGRARGLGSARRSHARRNRGSARGHPRGSGPGRTRGPAPAGMPGSAPVPTPGSAPVPMPSSGLVPTPGPGRGPSQIVRPALVPTLVLIPAPTVGRGMVRHPMPPRRSLFRRRKLPGTPWSGVPRTGRPRCAPVPSLRCAPVPNLRCVPVRRLPRCGSPVLGPSAVAVAGACPARTTGRLAGNRLRAVPRHRHVRSGNLTRMNPTSCGCAARAGAVGRPRGSPLAGRGRPRSRCDGGGPGDLAPGQAGAGCCYGSGPGWLPWWLPPRRWG